jgi:hypothetical protein
MSAHNTSRVLLKHLLGALSGVYLAQAIGLLIAKLWPDALLLASIITASFFVACEICMTIRELRKGPLSTGLIILDFLPFLLLGGGVSLFLGRLASQWFGSDWGGLVVFYGVYGCIIMAIAGIKQTVQDRNLQEDLEHPRASNPDEDQKISRKYMHPYI